MSEKKRKFHTLEEVLFPLRTEYQGKMRYLVPLLHMLIVSLMFSILYYVSIHVSYQAFRYIVAIVLLCLLVLMYISIRHRKNIENKES